MNADGRSVRIIEWEDLDKRKFFTLGIVMTLAIRAAVYPASLIRTRLQVQKGKSVYKGTADAFAKIARAEGARGLYRGFLVNALTIVSGQAYVTTYELARLYVSRFSDSNALKSLVAGGCASLVAQSITVPIDIISQHLMIQGKDSGAMGRFHLCATEGSALPLGRWRIVAAQILRADGPAGFYRGYTASLLTYIPNSAVWWPFYHAYTAGERGARGLPEPGPAGGGWTPCRPHRQHRHQPHGRRPHAHPGGGQVVHRGHGAAAAGRGGGLGLHQGPVGAPHLLGAHHRGHRRRLRDAQEAEPARRAHRLALLVTPTRRPARHAATHPPHSPRQYRDEASLRFDSNGKRQRTMNRQSHRATQCVVMVKLQPCRYFGSCDSHARPDVSVVGGGLMGAAATN
ncbi:solute carrier family 25 member 44-like isoform X1 [Lampetra planeri]